MSHPAALPDDELLRHCEMKFLRRSGPGGQHRNKVETAVRLRHVPTGIEAEANERRRQSENRGEALRRLRIKLALSVRGEVAEDAPPSELWQSRCRNRRIVVRVDHADFPALLAEALDRLADRDYDLRAAAEALGATSSQLWGLLQKEPAAFRQVNDERERRGLRRLRER
jgi:RF-1 domain